MIRLKNIIPIKPLLFAIGFFSLFFGTIYIGQKLGEDNFYRNLRKEHNEYVERQSSRQPVKYGAFNISDSSFKDSIMWQMLVENQFVRKGVEMCNIVSGEPMQEIAEKYAIGVINDHPNVTQLQLAVDTAFLLMMGIELGLWPENVGSNVTGQ